MDVVLALLVGFLYAAGLYLLLRRSLVKVVLGLAFLGHAANLLIFVAGGLRRDAAPVLSAATSSGQANIADPLPQALVLTAIVIGFGVLSFVLALARRTYGELGTDDVDDMRASDS